MMLSLVCDTETTGLDPHSDRIVEVGFIVTDWHEIRHAMRTYIDPEMAFDNKHNGLNSAAVAGAPSFTNIAPLAYLLFLQCDEIIAHNWPFDQRFFREEFARVGVNLPTRQTYDTMKVGGKRTLREACSRAGVNVDDLQLHSALDDCIATLRLCRAFRGDDPKNPVGGRGEVALTPRLT